MLMVALELVVLVVKVAVATQELVAALILVQQGLQIAEAEAVEQVFLEGLT